MHHASLQQQLTDLVAWATHRIACLDAQELYEESYALTQELREWILCLEEQPERLSLLLAPTTSSLTGRDRSGPNLWELDDRSEPRHPDGLLEI